MREGRGDLAIGPRPADWSGDVVSLGFEELVIGGHGPFPTPFADTDELRSAKWVHFEDEQGMSEVLDRAASELRFEPRVVAKVGQVAAALRLAVEGVGLALVPANAVPLGWSQHVRRTDPPLYRELVAYSLGRHGPLTGRFFEVLTGVQLPVVPANAVPDNAISR